MQPPKGLHSCHSCCIELRSESNDGLKNRLILPDGDIIGQIEEQTLLHLISQVIKTIDGLEVRLIVGDTVVQVEVGEAVLAATKLVCIDGFQNLIESILGALADGAVLPGLLQIELVDNNRADDSVSFRLVLGNLLASKLREHIHHLDRAHQDVHDGVVPLTESLFHLGSPTDAHTLTILLDIRQLRPTISLGMSLRVLADYANDGQIISSGLTAVSSRLNVEEDAVNVAGSGLHRSNEVLERNAPTVAPDVASSRFQNLIQGDGDILLVKLHPGVVLLQKILDLLRTLASSCDLPVVDRLLIIVHPLQIVRILIEQEVLETDGDVIRKDNNLTVRNHRAVVVQPSPEHKVGVGPEQVVTDRHVGDEIVTNLRASLTQSEVEIAPRLPQTNHRVGLKLSINTVCTQIPLAEALAPPRRGKALVKPVGVALGVVDLTGALLTGLTGLLVLLHLSGHQAIKKIVRSHNDTPPQTTRSEWHTKKSLQDTQLRMYLQGATMSRDIRRYASP